MVDRAGGGSRSDGGGMGGNGEGKCRGDVAVATTVSAAAAATLACRANTLSAVWRRSVVVSGRAAGDVSGARASHVLCAHMAFETARRRAQGCMRRGTQQRKKQNEVRHCEWEEVLKTEKKDFFFI